MRLIPILMSGLLGAAPCLFAAEGGKAGPDSGFSGMVIPMVIRSEETSWQLALAGIVFLPEFAPEANRSNASLTLTYSLRNQFDVALEQSFYFPADAYRLHGSAQIWHWPTDHFLNPLPPDGSGTASASESYLALGGLAEVFFSRRWFGWLHAGPRLRREAQENELARSGDLAGGAAQGRDGFDSWQAGAKAEIDRRDNPTAPGAGYLLTASALFPAGGSLRYSVQEFQARKYFGFGSWERVIALAASAETRQGDLPFNRHATPDGTTLLRGAAAGRFAGANLVGAQIEYRHLLGTWGRVGPLGATLYGEAVKVFSDGAGLRRNPVHSLVGIGLRYFVIPEERVAIRADISLFEGAPVLVVNALEAF